MTLNESRALVLKIFNGDVTKANFWWNTKNSHFGNVSPIFVWKKKPEQVLAFIESSKP